MSPRGFFGGRIGLRRNNPPARSPTSGSGGGAGTRIFRGAQQLQQYVSRMNSARSTHPHVSTPGFELEELAPLVSPQQILPAVDRPMTTPSTPPTLPTLNFNSPAEFTAPIDANPMRISERTAQWIAENPYDETQRAQQRSSMLNTAWFVLTNLGTIGAVRLRPKCA